MAALLLTAGVSEAANGDGQPLPAAKQSPCRPDSSGTLVLRRVFFAPYRPGEVVQSDSHWFVRRDGHLRRTSKRSAKMALFVRGERPVSLRTQKSAPVWMTGWDGNRTARRAVIDTSTPADIIPGFGTRGHCHGDDPWRFYAGGLVWKGKRCARVAVETDGRSKLVRFGLGRRCD